MSHTLREYTSPLLAVDSSAERITDLFVDRLAAAPNHVLFHVPDGAHNAGASTWRDVSTREFFDQVKVLARHLIAAGVEPGDAVAIMGPTSYHWVLADVAALWVGAIIVPIYDTSASAQVEAIVADAHVTRAIAGNATQALMLAHALGSKDRVWTFTHTGASEFPSLDVLLGEQPSREVSAEELETARTSRGSDDVATIVYTSGTTSSPKGVLLTHGNFLSQLENIAISHGAVLNQFGSTILFLPLSHVLARAVSLLCISLGMRVAHLSDTSRMLDTFSEIRPTFVMVVPRVLDKILNAAGAKAEAKKLGRVWNDARLVAQKVGQLRESVNEFQIPHLPLGLRLRWLAYDALFYSKIRELLGGNIVYVLCGGAKLHRDLAWAFHGMSIPVIEGYGLTESTAPIAANRPGDLRAGSVGVPVAGTTIKIADDGEVLVKGPGISPGYTNPEHTAQVFVDGFFRTGDLGFLDVDGRLTLSGRSKDVIVTAGGKTIEPAGWEGAAEKHPEVTYAVAVGDDRPFLTAILVLEGDSTSASPDGMLAPIDDPELATSFVESLEAANRDVSRSEAVKRFAVVCVDLSDPDFVTPSLKLKRAVFLKKAHNIIEALYVKDAGAGIYELVKRTGH